MTDSQTDWGKEGGMKRNLAIKVVKICVQTLFEMGYIQRHQINELDRKQIVYLVKDELDEYFHQELSHQATEICILIDEIESKSETNTLEEWKQYKHIRNAIRNKYVLEDK